MLCKGWIFFRIYLCPKTPAAVPLFARYRAVLKLHLAPGRAKEHPPNLSITLYLVNRRKGGPGAELFHPFAPARCCCFFAGYGHYTIAETVLSNIPAIILNLFTIIRHI